MAFIEVDQVSKHFQVHTKAKGMWPALKSLVKRDYTTKKAVQDISFHIERGELVAYIGPNGAGKSTTIKMLSGILQPTSGTIQVGDIVPYQDRKQNAMRMGVVFGQRSQLYWDLAMEDTFDLYKHMYKIEEQQFKRNVEFYVELLQMQEFLTRPVRQLSLGQKMRANLAVALLHDPDVVYLDEPTIGLDIIAKSRIRQFVKEVNKEKQTTLMLTTHDMDDIEQICNRIIMIDQGQVLYDGSLSAFKESYAGGHFIRIELESDSFWLEDERLTVVKDEGPLKTIQFQKKQIAVPEVIQILTAHNRVKDIQMRETSIEDIVKDMYESRSTASEG
ncbi:ATP-binding cassette domain-containing protein [Paenibacillus hemerocallicola]|uniref:ATP-binding cassette domain-containing protein n=1 Tax=Paenibacillus hemerocallicola TaxID=1172614 RepID=A0A5C4TC38_9BACL|nr:ATP-binding cassette domain-containing protein [Paenibacillus hemerocallicola]TNJ66047.1 ATP-binding cassette domain-containing protein [Paenibacillus hemerocallicola]